MDESTYEPNLISITPAKVRHDNRISHAEKTLYAEITALTIAKGYCYASNGYFARNFDVTERTVIRWLNNLEECGYIYRDYEYCSDGKTVKKRKIYLKWISNLADDREITFSTVGDITCTKESDKNVTGHDKNVTQESDKNVIQEGDINVVENNKYINNKYKYKKEIYKEKQKHAYGENGNVLLTDEEFEKLKDKFPDYESKINDLSYYMASKGAKYKSHYATILNWARKDEKKNDTSKLKGAGLKYVGVDMGF